MANVLNSNELRKGTVYVEDGQTWKVLDYKHIKMGRTPATNRVKVLNLHSGVITEKTYASQASVEEADVSKKNAQYLYSDGQNAHFMDNDDYSQFSFPLDSISEELKYLVEGAKVIVLFVDGKQVSIEIAKSVELEVIDAPNAVAGDTATNASKRVKLITGIEIDAPLFIKRGDVLKVNTESGTYVSRV